jgi:SAM-dependent methyltransferase
MMDGAACADPRREYFDRLASDWDRAGPDPQVTLARLRGLAGRFAFRAGMEVLEVGCGTGQISGWLAEQVAPGRVVAVDFAPAMLAQAQGRGLDVEFRCADVCVPGTLEGRFDRVLCFHCFPHLRDPALALAQMRGCLTEGGELLVVHLAGSAPLNAFHARLAGAVAHDRLPPAAEWEPLLRTAGLRAVELEDREDLFWLRALAA